MSFKKAVRLFSAATVVAAAAAYGCSSSSGDNGNGPIDSGMDTSNPGKDSSAKDSSQSNDTGGGDDSSDTGTLACPPTDTSTFKPAAYVNATANQGLCTSQQIAAFVMACGDNSTMTSCGDWQTANTASEAGAGNACGGCIFATMNNGATWVDPNNFFTPNYAGCIQLTDATNGAKCAAAYDAIAACEGTACDQCTSNTDYSACRSAADKAGCKQYNDTFVTACKGEFADGGAGMTCSPGAAQNKQDPDLTYIANLICGGAPADGGGG
jgi:hypothetical protein